MSSVEELKKEITDVLQRCKTLETDSNGFEARLSSLGNQSINTN